jgi:DNA-binding response OmpR family regulator
MEIAGKIKILVVDDERAIANSLGWVLNMEGFEIRTAYSGEDAVEIAQAFLPNVLICDVLMGGMSGIEAAKLICEKLPSCKVLLVSGHVPMENLLQLDGQLAFDYLGKPAHPRVLLEKLRNILQRSNKQTAPQR